MEKENRYSEENEQPLNDPEASFYFKLKGRLDKLKVWYRFVEKKGSTIHTADASEITGIALSRISKNIISKTKDGRYAALIIPGDRKIDFKKAANALNSKSIHLVPFESADSISGYPPGGTPSLCYDRELEVILDEELSKYETFYCGGGSTRMLLELKKEDIVRLNRAKIESISTGPGGQ